MDLVSYLERLRVIPFIKKWNILNLVLGFIDILAILFAFQLAYLINDHPGAVYFFQEVRYLKLFSLILPVWLIILYFIQIAEIPRTKSYTVLFFEYMQSAMLVAVLLMVFYFLFKLYHISRLFLFEFTVAGFLFLFFTRLLEYKLFKNPPR